MTIFISNLAVSKLHGLYDLDVSLNKGTNIIYGPNGSGKTTIIQILSNAINEDWDRFVHIQFEKITLTYSDDSTIELEKKIEQKKNSTPKNPHFHTVISYVNAGKKGRRQICSYTSAFTDSRDKRVEENTPTQHSALYIPAFRSLLDASFVTNLTDTQLARRVYDNFVPIIEIYSYKNILTKIDEEVRDSINKIIKRDSALLQRLPILRNQLAEKPTSSVTPLPEVGHLFDEIKKYPVYIDETIIDDVNSDQVDPPLLLAYQQTWQEMLQVRQKHLEILNTLFDSLNRFLGCKKIQYSPATSFENDPPFIEVVVNDGRVIPLDNGLSSGERQLFTILFASTRLADEEVVLIDEPEISLGTFWQSQLLKEAQKLLGTKQLIVCTHSVEIGENFSDDHVVVLGELGCKTHE